MEYRLARAALLVLALPLGAAAQQSKTPIDIRLDSKVVRLANGTTVLLHQDRQMPEVGVEVFIRGGSREEMPGTFGTAHLFEHHLPTSGRFLGNSENRAIYNRTRRGSGAGTEADFLRFYLTAKPEGLEAIIGALADRMESDSMKYLPQNLTNDKNVVISELRRVSTMDWDTELRARLHEGTFGKDHPYGHSSGGSEADVNAATIDLMQRWHRQFAGGANTIVIVAGNFDVDVAESLVRKHFEPIRAGAAAVAMRKWVPEARAIREVAHREVPNGYVYLQWPIPGFGTHDGELLRLLGAVYANRLLDSAQVAVTVELWEIAGQFRIRAQTESAATLDGTEAQLKKELARLLETGPTAAELARARTQLLTEFVSSLQAPVWRGGRGDVLGLGLLFEGDAGYFRTQVAQIESATPLQIRDAGRRWISKPGYVLHVHPAPRRKAAGSIDRAASITPMSETPTPFPTARAFATRARTQLLVVERPQVPLAELTLAIRAGTSTADPVTARAALAAFEAITADSLAALGATVSSNVDADFATLTVSILSARAPAAALVLLRSLERAAQPMARRISAGASAQAMRAVREEVADPFRARDIVLDCVIAGRTDCATLSRAARTNEEIVESFMAKRYRPENATLIASGAVTPQMLGAAPGVEVQPAARAPSPAARALRGEQAFILDLPTATQAHALLAVQLPAGAAADPLLAQLVTFSLRQRLMENLRVAKGWSYEVYPFGVNLRSQLAFIRFNIPLKLERVGDGIAEVMKEMQRLASEPASDDALNSWKSYVEGFVLLPGLTSLAAMNQQLLELPRNNLDLDYYRNAQQRLRAFTAADLQRAAQQILVRDAMTWIVAGPAQQIEAELKEAGLSPTQVK